MTDFYCCCGPCKTHVEKGSLFIAFVGFVLNVAEAIYNFIGKPAFHNNGTSITAGVSSLIVAFLYLSIILAHQKQNHSLFLPYLIIVGIGLFFNFVLIILNIFFLITAPKWLIDEINKAESKEHDFNVDDLRIILAVSLAVMSVFFAINFWLYSVIYRAYKHMKSGGLAVNGGGYPTV